MEDKPIRITVKLYYRPGNIIRKFLIDPSISLETFMNKVREFEGARSTLLQNSPLQMMYCDSESDWITFDDQSEWEEAIRVSLFETNHDMRVKAVNVMAGIAMNSPWMDQIRDSIESIKNDFQSHVESIQSK